jgi:hypothetical protein
MKPPNRMAVVIGIGKDKPNPGPPPPMDKYDDSTDSFPGKPNSPAGVTAKPEPAAPKPPVAPQPKVVPEPSDPVSEFAKKWNVGDDATAREAISDALRAALKLLGGSEEATEQPPEVA